MQKTIPHKQHIKHNNERHEESQFNSSLVILNRNAYQNLLNAKHVLVLPRQLTNPNYQRTVQIITIFTDHLKYITFSKTINSRSRIPQTVQTQIDVQCQYSNNFNSNLDPIQTSNCVQNHVKITENNPSSLILPNYFIISALKC